MDALVPRLLEANLSTAVYKKLAQAPGLSLVENTLVVCLPLPPYPVDLSLPPSSLPFSALLPGAEDEVAMGT